MGSYLAHVAEDGRQQTVLQHLSATAQKCTAFAQVFHAAEQGDLAGLAHDLGKYSNEFQDRLLHHGPRVDHATAGAFECFRLGQPYAAFAVAGHHGGLPDGGGQTDDPDSSSFFGRMNRALQGRLPEYAAWLNAQRCSILERCIQEGERCAPGLYTLTVPTGGGKTVASLAFALAQAKAQGLRRLIYVIPYPSIIEQTAQKFREILGADCVLEHHSGVLYDVDQEAGPESIRLARATETWDMPVIVTTAVQFFESLYSCRPSLPLPLELAGMLWPIMKILLLRRLFTPILQDCWT